MLARGTARIAAVLAKPGICGYKGTDGRFLGLKINARPVASRATETVNAATLCASANASRLSTVSTAPARITRLRPSASASAPLGTSRTIAKALCTANTAPIAPIDSPRECGVMIRNGRTIPTGSQRRALSRMKWRVSRSMAQAECITPIVWPSGSLKRPMTRPSMTSSGPIMRVPPRLSACASEASTSGTST